MLPAGWLIIRTGPGWNVWDGYGEHWAASRLWLALSCAWRGSARPRLPASYSLLSVAAGAGPS